MNMMRYRVFLLFGLLGTLPVVAQNIFTEPPRVEPETQGNQTNQLFDLDVNVGSAKVKTDSSTPDVMILPDGFSDGMIGVEREEDVATNKVMSSKLSFLMSTGVEYADEGEYEAAERAYLRALEEAPDSEDILFRLGTLYVTMERFPDAIRIFKQLAARFPENPLTHNNLAWCYATGPGVINTSKALRHSREALLFAPYSSSAWNTLAEAYYVSGDYKKALRSSEHAIDLLQRSESPEGSLESFMAQRAKILRAQEAMKLLDGMSE